ncbi:MAG: Ig-like domain-containing protein [Treponema sp.]|jgi:hypothetical protein|nr:Ig-like domain-containing protein [Treponema sp.]
MKQNFVPLELLVLAVLFVVMGGKNSVSPSLDIPAVKGVTISPKTAALDTEGTQQFTAVVDAVHGADETVTWTVEGNSSAETGIEANTQGALLTVASDETATTLTVKVVSVFDIDKFDSAEVTVQSESPDPAVKSVTISLKTAVLDTGGTQQFTAVVDAVHGADETVTWTVEGNSSAETGIEANTQGALLTVASDETATTLTVKAVSVFDIDKFDTAEVTVQSESPDPTIKSVTVKPDIAIVSSGGTRQFTVVVDAVNGDAGTVTWTVEGSSSAETRIEANAEGALLTVVSTETATSLTVKAVSVFDTSKFDTAAVTVQSESPDPIPDTPFIALDNSDHDAAYFNGMSMYTLIRSAPASKPQGDRGKPVPYSYTLSTSAGPVSSKTPDTDRNTAADDALAAPYSKAHRELDIRLRGIEQELLAAGKPQLSKNDFQGRTVAPPISVGTLWNNVYIIEDRKNINTTCKHISEHAYFFMDNSIPSSPDLTDYGQAFDSIYDINREKFGHENDVDENGKIIIVLTSLPGTILGYFYSGDKYPKSAISTSNEGDIFYVSSSASKGLIYATLAHEFQHMIYFDEHANRNSGSTYIWLNEALSQAAEHYNGYYENHNAWMAAFLLASRQDQENLSLTHWTDYNYGYGALFIRYMIDRYGDSAIKKMCATNLAGIAAVEAATGADFNDIFTDFTRALIMSGTGDSTDPRYSFTSLNLRSIQSQGRGGLVIRNSRAAGAQVTDSVYPYSIRTLRWTGEFGALRLTGNNVQGDVFGLLW